MMAMAERTGPPRKSRRHMGGAKRKELVRHTFILSISSAFVIVFFSTKKKKRKRYVRDLD
jgi:hypothetical protein